MDKYLPYISVGAIVMINIIIKGASRSPGKFKPSDLNFGAESALGTIIFIGQYFSNHPKATFAGSADIIFYPLIAMILVLVLSIYMGQKVDLLENQSQPHTLKTKMEMGFYLFSLILVSSISLCFGIEMK